jgi:hypothetical protein
VKSPAPSIPYPYQYVGYKEQKEVANDLKPIYQAINKEQALAVFDAFDGKRSENSPVLPSLGVIIGTKSEPSSNTQKQSEKPFTPPTPLIHSTQ